MSDTVDTLILDLLEWMGPSPRPFGRGRRLLQFSQVFDQIVAYAVGTPTNVVNQRVLERGSPRR